MSLKDNFYQAIRELLDHSGLVGSDLEDKSKDSSELDSYLETSSKPEVSSRASTPASDFHVPEPEFNAPEFSWRPPEPGLSSGSSAREEESAVPKMDSRPSMPVHQTTTEMTIISKNTLVSGDIRSFAGITIEGSVKGQVDVVKDAYISGKLLGGLKCNNASMHGSSLQGDTRAKGNVQLDNNSLMIGNLNAQHASVDGKVKGNLQISGKIELDANAVVLGDVTTSTLTVIDGANIKGYVNTTFMTEEAERAFPGQISISEEEELMHLDDL